MDLGTEIGCKNVRAAKIEVPIDKEIAALNEIRNKKSIRLMAQGPKNRAWRAKRLG